MKRILLFVVLLHILFINNAARAQNDVQTAWIARYNGSGGNYYDFARALVVDANGNVYVTGSGEVLGQSTNYVTIKYDADGQQLWAARYNGSGGNYPDDANAIALDNAGNVYVTGRSEKPGHSGDYATIKYNASGEQQWEARYNGSGGNYDDIAHSLAVDASGNVYVTGGSYIFGVNAAVLSLALITITPPSNTTRTARSNGSRAIMPRKAIMKTTRTPSPSILPAMFMSPAEARFPARIMIMPPSNTRYRRPNLSPKFPLRCRRLLTAPRPGATTITTAIWTF